MKTFIARLATGTASVLAAGLLLPACVSLDRSTHIEAVDAYAYDVSATILSLSDGVRSVAIPANLWAEPGPTHFVYFQIQPDDPTTDVEAFKYWKRDLTALLDPSDGHGAGPWCLLTATASSDHLRLHRPAASTDSRAGVAELADCPTSTVLAQLELSHSELRFDPLGVGFVSAPQSVMLTNRSGVALDMAEPVLDRIGQWREFSLERGTCTILAPADHVRLEPGAACTFSVSFQPSASGERAADVRIASSDHPEATVAVHLGGRGVAGTIAVDRNFCVIPDPSDGCFRRDLQVINLGPGRVTIESLPANGDWQLSNWRRVDATGMPVPIPAPPIRDIDPTSASMPTDVFVSVSSCLADPAPTTLSIGLGPGEAPIGISVTPLTFPGRCTP